MCVLVIASVWETITWDNLLLEEIKTQLSWLATIIRAHATCQPTSTSDP